MLAAMPPPLPRHWQSAQLSTLRHRGGRQTATSASSRCLLGSGSVSETQWRTHRLELDDQTLREWDAVVLAAVPDGIVLDRSAFYPGGGGSRPTTGSCSGVACRRASRARGKATISTSSRRKATRSRRQALPCAAPSKTSGGPR